MMDAIILEITNLWQAMVTLLAFDPARLAEPEMVLRLTLQCLLLIGSAFFSSSETALFSLSRLELRELRRSRNPRADTLHALLDQPRRLIISILCGNEIINVAAAANMTAILVHLYSDEQVVLLNILIMVPLLLLVGEVTPKTIAVTNPVALSTRVIAAPMALWIRLVAPFRWSVRLLSERVTTLIVGPEKRPENILQVDEFRSLVDEVVEHGELHATERILIDNLLAAGSTEVVEIMIPRTRVAFISGELSVPEVVEQVRRLRHRRIPVYSGHRDTLIGMLHAEELMQMALEDVDFAALQLEALLHPVIMVPPTKKVDEMFEFFLQHNAQAAVVLNEFGGVDGLITLKGLVNFIFGHASGEEPLRELFTEPEEGVYEVDGGMKLSDFNAISNFGLIDRRMTTISGVVLRHLDRPPQAGDEVIVEGIRLQVISVDGHRIATLRAMPASHPLLTADQRGEEANSEEDGDEMAESAEESLEDKS
ncbi:MAG: hemolysin family protein [Gammaproteobacteria bacterium]|nr:hemolysin family protein [Gammaproteobacteria bacterium]